MPHFYRYDPLDRLTDVAGYQGFYNQARLATEIQGTVQRSVFQVGDHLLAEGGTGGSNLLATDLQRSVLHTLNPDKTHPIGYNVYGHRPAESGLSSVLGFNGERADPVTGHYLLGNGYRAFNPVLMRFNSPDSLSPFGRGGINSYGYCKGDPINQVDPSGHTPLFLKRLLRSMKIIKKAPTSKIETYANGIPMPREGVPFNKGLLSGKEVNFEKLYPTIDRSQAIFAKRYNSSIKFGERLKQIKEAGTGGPNIESMILLQKARAIDSAGNYFSVPIPEMKLREWNSQSTSGLTAVMSDEITSVAKKYAWLHESRDLGFDNAKVRQ